MTTGQGTTTTTSSTMTTTSGDSNGPKTVLLYRGAPVCKTCDEFVGNVVASPKTAELKKLAPKVQYVSNWKDVPAALEKLPKGSIFVIAGTDDDLSPWAKGGSQEMTASSITAIQNWVKNGGRYLGICGGANVAPATYSDSGFSFKALDLAPVVSTNFKGDKGKEHIENVVWKDGNTYGMYFQMGSYFTQHSSNEHFEITANYLASTSPLNHGTGIAAVQYSYGNGKVLVSGVHPEATVNYWDNNKAPANFVAHTELLEQIMVDLLSDRKL